MYRRESVNNSGSNEFWLPRRSLNLRSEVRSYRKERRYFCSRTKLGGPRTESGIEGGTAQSKRMWGKPRNLGGIREVTLGGVGNAREDRLRNSVVARNQGGKGPPMNLKGT